MFTGLESPVHLLIVLLVILLLFGAKRVPELGRGLGEGIRAFREGMNAGSEEDGNEGPGTKKLGSRREDHEDG